MRNVLIACTIFSIVFSFQVYADDFSKRMQEIDQQMVELGKKVQACGQNVNCRKPILDQMNDLAKEATELTAAAGLSSEVCETSSDPCCYAEQSKQHIRNIYHTEPTWIQYMPVHFELIWDIFEENYESKVKYILRQEYPGCLSFLYDQEDKTRLLNFQIKGPTYYNQAQDTIISIQGVFTPDEGPVKSRRINNPADYYVGTGGIHFDWINDSQNYVDCGIKGPTPKEVYSEEGNPFDLGATFSDIDFDTDAMDADALSLDELKQGLKSGKCVKEYKIEFSLIPHLDQVYPPAAEATRELQSLPEVPDDYGEHVRRGKVTVTINFKPTGGLVVTPNSGFNSSGPDMKDSFDPSSKTYILKNTSDSPISYQVAKKAKWLELSQTSGTIPPDNTATVKVSINESVAKALKEDTYKDTLTFTNTTNSKGNTTRPVELNVSEEQVWQVFLTGNETDELNPYWKITTKVNGAVRFDYKLRGQFTIKKEKGKWKYKGGTITIAEVGLSNLFEPVDVWIVKPFKCVFCDNIFALKGKPLNGTVMGNTVKLYWGKYLKPRVDVSAKIRVSCKPMPLCAQWKERLYISDHFFDKINGEPLTLQDGYTKPGKSTDPRSKLRWINYTFTLKRLK